MVVATIICDYYSDVPGTTSVVVTSTYATYGVVRVTVWVEFVGYITSVISS